MPKVMSRNTQYLPSLTLSQALEAMRPQSCIDTTSNITTSETNWGTALQWIDDCCKNHETCAVTRHAMDLETAWLPSRLIEVETSGGIKSDIVYLRDGFCKDDLVQYATLSHCWGLEPTFLKLTLATLTTFKTGVKIEKLSRSFQDSITFTRRLGLRYIWIDALCIIQDSKQDWLREAALMAKVYSRSQINLAATASLDSNGGFLRTRNPLTIVPLRVEFDCAGLVVGTYFCFLQDPWLRYMKWAPLMRRAWIFQERLLAPRTIHFGPEQLLWECNELQASETHPKGNAFISQSYYPGMLNGKLKKEFATLCQIKNTSENNAAVVSAWMTKPPEAGFEIARAWEAIVEEYTNLSLTNESDKLIAIAGVASLLKESIPRQRYLAGIWEKHLSFALLWHTVAPGRRPQQYQAPSWSWASIIGHLWLGDPRGERFERLELDILEASTTPEHTEFGSVKDGYLRLRSRLCKARLLHDDRAEHSEGHVLDLGRATIDDDYDFVWIDEAESTYHTYPGQEVFCFQITFADPSEFLGPNMDEEEGSGFAAQGLLLEPTGRSRGQYNRVGKFHLRGSYACDALKEAFKLPIDDETLFEAYDDRGRYTITVL